MYLGFRINAHSQSNAVFFAVTIFPSGLTGSELRLFKNLSQSVSQEKIDKFTVLRTFSFEFYCRSRVSLCVASADIACLSLDEVNGTR